MSTPPAQSVPFIWYELLTTDHTAAFDFYSRVLGWTLAKNDFTGPEYTIVNAGPFNVGGMMTLPAEACAAGARPCWMTYLGVADLDATIARVVASGGAVTRAPSDIPGVGRWAMLADPQGAMFIAMKPISTEPMPVVPEGTPGTVGWRELHAGDGEKAFAWYAEQFGWSKAGAVSMGEMGTYQLFSAGPPATAKPAQPGSDTGKSTCEAPGLQVISTLDEQAVGGMMTKMPDTPQPFWTFYFYVDDLDAAVGRATAAGGQVLLPPHEVPGPMWIAYLADPQGATFGLLANQR